MNRAAGGAARPAPVKGSAPLKDKVRQLEARVTIVENYLQATSASGTSSQTSKILSTYGGLEQMQFLVRSARNPHDGKLTVAEVIEDLQGRVVNIEEYLQATGGGSGNSRGRLSQGSMVYIGGEGGGRRLRGDQDSGGSGTSRAMDTYNGLLSTRSGGAASSLKDQVQDLEARVAAIVKYLVAAGGSGNSRQQVHQLLQMLAAAGGGGR